MSFAAATRGCFRWYFNEDMLPKSRPMRKVLREAIP